jgi:hypothetical protein
MSWDSDSQDLRKTDLADGTHQAVVDSVGTYDKAGESTKLIVRYKFLTDKHAGKKLSMFYDTDGPFLWKLNATLSKMQAEKPSGLTEVKVEHYYAAAEGCIGKVVNLAIKRGTSKAGREYVDVSVTGLNANITDLDVALGVDKNDQIPF